jgi:hypothetical protein
MPFLEAVRQWGRHLATRETGLALTPNEAGASAKLSSIASALKFTVFACGIISVAFDMRP